MGCCVPLTGPGVRDDTPSLSGGGTPALCPPRRGERPLADVVTGHETFSTGTDRLPVALSDGSGRDRWSWGQVRSRPLLNRKGTRLGYDPRSGHVYGRDEGLGGVGEG